MNTDKFKILQEWHQLFKDGLISEEEFAKKKAAILGIPLNVSVKEIPTETSNETKSVSENKGDVTEIFVPKVSSVMEAKSEYVEKIKIEPEGNSPVTTDLGGDNPKRKFSWLMMMVASLFLLSVAAGALYFFYFKDKNSSTPVEEGSSVQTNNISSIPEDNSKSYSNNTRQYRPGFYIAKGADGSKRIYFHNSPDEATKRKGYIVSGESVYVRRIQNGYGYIEYTNTKGNTTVGWLRMIELQAQ